MNVRFELTGTMPMLMHHDDVEASDHLRLWRDAAENKNVTVRGDDRSPPWTWQTYLYSDGDQVTMPSANVWACLLKAGTKMTLKGNKTFKEASQNGMFPSTEFYQFLHDGKEVAIAPIIAIKDEPFEVHKALVEKLGFRLWSKRAKVGQVKHVRTRPRFDVWSVIGEFTAEAPELTFPVLQEMFRLAGQVGLGDWRPGSPKSPGPYGMFAAKLTKLSA